MGIIHSKFSFDGFRQLNTAAALATQAFTSEDKKYLMAAYCLDMWRKNYFKACALGYESQKIYFLYELMEIVPFPILSVLTHRPQG